VLVLITLSSSASLAFAWPMLPPRPVPDAIAGAADPHVAGIFYNPAAIGPLRGVQLWWDQSASLQLGTISRDSGEAQLAGKSAPITSPSIPSFLGATWDLFTDRIVLGLAVMSPFNELTQYPANSAVRYQAIWQRGATLEEVVSVGIRVSNRFYIGTSANFAESFIDYRFDRDTAPANGSAGIDQPSARCGNKPCGLENPLAAEDTRVQGWGWGIGFSVGILTRPIDRLWIGLSYISHIFYPFRSTDVPLSSSDGATVKAPAGSPNPDCGPNGSAGTTCTGHALVSVYVPDIINLALRVEATARLEVEASARWVHYGGRNALDVYLQGGTLDHIGAADPGAAVPGQMRLDRGWQDAWAVGASLRWRVSKSLRLSPSAMFETSAADNAYVSAANLEGNKLDLALALEWKPRAHLTVGAHIGSTAYFVGQAGGGFDPRAQATCADAGYNLSSCTKYIDGAALPSAAGRYTMGTVHAGFALGMDY
jgi:long-subunit fatty acid transport protein